LDTSAHGSVCSIRNRFHVPTYEQTRTRILSPVPTSSDSEEFVRLDAELPLRVGNAIGDGLLSVLPQRRTIHRREREPLEVKIAELLRRYTVLGEHEFELVTSADLQLRPGLGADTHPIDARGELDRAVCLQSNLKPVRVKRIDYERVDLK